MSNAPAATFKPTAKERGFWPLNEDVQGRNLVSGKGDFVLHDVEFSTGNEFMHAPARFSSDAGSYAEILNNNKIQMTTSFSWIGAVNTKVTGNGPLFEWDNGVSGGSVTHIWIFDGKLFTSVIFPPKGDDNCLNQVHHDTPIVNNKWHVLAVSYSMESRLITMWMDGEKEETQAKPCSEGQELRPANNVFINCR